MIDLDFYNRLKIDDPSKLPHYTKEDLENFEHPPVMFFFEGKLFILSNPVNRIENKDKERLNFGGFVYMER
jgi:hypothetical protein